MAASTNSTASMIPRLMLRKAGLGTSITAVSEIITVRPLNRTALPAVSIVTAVARRASRPEPNSAPRNRYTMNRA